MLFSHFVGKSNFFHLITSLAVPYFQNFQLIKRDIHGLYGLLHLLPPLSATKSSQTFRGRSPGLCEYTSMTWRTGRLDLWFDKCLTSDNKKVCQICQKKHIYGDFHKWGSPKWLVYTGKSWKILLKWMTKGYTHFRKPHETSIFSRI